MPIKMGLFYRSQTGKTANVAEISQKEQDLPYIPDFWEKSFIANRNPSKKAGF